MLVNYVAHYRKAAGLTLVQLAELSGIPVSTINDIERGSEPRIVTAILIARALQVPVEQLWVI